MYVNLFIASVLNWKEKGLVLHQETDYPDKASTKLTITAAPVEGVRMPMMLRYPSWAVKGVTVKINGKTIREKSSR